MVNAGAITVAALLREVLGDTALEVMLDRFSRAAGRALRISDAVFRSEAETGHRNRAIGHLLVNAGAAKAPVEPALDLYFQQCSILVDAADLARMGATLANLGENPASGDQVFDPGAVRDTLSVMFTCGMYDYSGHWALDVGIPAKSGVGGGVVGVVNRQLGIGTFSPRARREGQFRPRAARVQAARGRARPARLRVHQLRLGVRAQPRAVIERASASRQAVPPALDIAWASELAMVSVPNKPLSSSTRRTTGCGLHKTNVPERCFSRFAEITITRTPALER